MNYIHQLQQEKQERGQALAAVQRHCNQWLTLLHSDKFAGVDSDGDRKDWVNLADVIHQVLDIRSKCSGHSAPDEPLPSNQTNNP